MVRTSPVEAVVSALITTLRATTALTPLVSGIYNDVPQGTAYPYVVVTVPTNRRSDTIGCFGNSALVDTKVVSQYRGDREAARIQAAMISALNFQEPALAGGHRVLGLSWDSADSYQDVVNGVPTRYHVSTWRAWTEQTTS